MDGTFTVKNGETVYLPAPVSGGTLVDVWSGSLNGTAYLVAGVVISSETRLYASEEGGDWYEITGIGTWDGAGTDSVATTYGNAGNTRFASESTLLVFAAAKAPQIWVGGSGYPSRDVLIIQNGVDYPRVWDPGRPVEATLTVSTCADNGSGLVRVTFTGTHPLNTGDTIVLSGITGTTEANGSWTVTRVSTTAIDLQGSAFANAYVSGGTASKGDHRLTVHQNLTVPDRVKSFAQKLTFPSFFQVSATAGANKTYYSAGVINQGDFRFAASTHKPYTGSNECPGLRASEGAVDGDIATIWFKDANSSSGVDIRGGLALFFEDRASNRGASQLMSICKIEVNCENVAYNTINTTNYPWHVVYDPTSTDSEETRKLSFPLGGPEGENPRNMFYFPTDHLADAGRIHVYHIRLTFKGASLIIDNNCDLLAVCGCGQIQGGVQFSISYEHEGSKRESYAIENKGTTLASLREVGGPPLFASTQGDFTIPYSPLIPYDYDLTIPNAEGGILSSGSYVLQGGLNGEPSRVNLYARLPGEETAYYWYSLNLYTAGYFTTPFVGRGWLKTNSSQSGTFLHSTSSVTSLTLSNRDTFRPAPSAYQIGIPKARVMEAGSNRLFVGDILDTLSQRQPGDLYFSAEDQPFRMQAISLRDGDGGRIAIAGETITRILASAAQAQGASYIHIFTDQSLGILGGSGAFAADTMSTEALSRYARIGARGTLSPRSVSERNGSIIWLDQEGQMQQIVDGAILPNIGRFWIEDQTLAVPSGILDRVCGAHWQDRFYMAYGVAGASVNSLVLVRNEVVRAWEAVDAPSDQPFRMVRHKNGAFETLLMFDATGASWTYESDTAGTAAVQIGTGDIGDRAIDGAVTVNSVELVCDPVEEGTLTIDRYYWPGGGQYQTTLALDDGRATDLSQLPTIVTEGTDGESDRSARLVLSGTLPSGTRLYLLAATIDQATSKHNVGS